jgi:hypothetical protein
VGGINEGELFGPLPPPLRFAPILVDEIPPPGRLLPKVEHEYRLSDRFEFFSLYPFLFGCICMTGSHPVPVVSLFSSSVYLLSFLALEVSATWQRDFHDGMQWNAIKSVSFSCRIVSTE